MKSHDMSLLGFAQAEEETPNCQVRKELQRPCSRDIRVHYLNAALKVSSELKKLAADADSELRKKRIAELLVMAWPSAIVCRSDIASFSGGVLHPATMANKDASHEGVVSRFTRGRKVFYLAVDAAQFVVDQIAD